MAIDYKLVPFGSSAVTKRGYRAVVDNDGYVKDTEDILEETADRFGLKAPQLKMCMEAVLDTMIKKVADDGIRRRFGNYFTLRLDIKGSFEGKDSKPDGSQRPCFKLQMLGAFKDAAKKIRLKNEVLRKRIYIKGAAAVSTQERGVIKWGDAVCFWGRNLKPIIGGDYLTWRFTDAEGVEHDGRCTPYVREGIVDKGRKKWDILFIDWPEDMPRSAIGCEVAFTCHSRAGDPSAEMQEHSASAVVREV